MNFRIWCREMWYKHVDELMSLGLPPPEYALKEYFNKYKYWLKREYRHQQNANR